jgi:hypothetical protein
MARKLWKVRIFSDSDGSGAAIKIAECGRRRTAVTQQAVERALGKLLTDENFRERFFAGPELACWEAGFALSPVELEALSRLPHEALAHFSEALDKRIRRPCLDPNRRENEKVSQS